MILKLFKYLGILSLILSYTSLIANYVIHGDQSFDTALFYWAWGSGILSVICNAVYAIKTHISDFVLSTYGLVALVWLAPFFIEFEATDGVASMVIFLILVVYIHVRNQPTKVDSAPLDPRN